MPGAILQLVANSDAPQNVWLDKNPDITFFKKVYRRHTPFAKELDIVQFKNPVNFGTTSNATILSNGDLVYRIFFVFDIPKLEAIFPNSKSEDLNKLLNTLELSDNNFLVKVQKYTSKNNQVEFGQILNLIDTTINDYDLEELSRLKILDLLNTYVDKIGTSELDLSQKIKYYYDPRLENDSNIINENHFEKTVSPYDYDKFKMDLMDLWIGQKKEYYPIYELIKSIYLSEKDILDKIPLTDPDNITKEILYANIFYNLIPNREILLMANLNGYESMVKKFSIYQIFNELYTTTTSQINNNNFTTDPTKLNISILRKNSESSIDHDFGSEFHYMLNSYNTIINIINSLAVTTPIVIVKAFLLEDKNYNIYLDNQKTNLKPKYYPTIVDPNFKNNYFLKVINAEKPIEDNLFNPINIDDSNQIYQNSSSDIYLNLFIDHSNIMFDIIKKSMDKLFETYRTKLFSSVNMLFYNNSFLLSNIYSYLVPDKPFMDNENKRIFNVFNANIWFFYFFKYLDMLNETNLINYVNQNIFKMTNSGMKFMKYLFILLKINIEYYMNEISSLLNDMYASAPSVNQMDTMKNYTPVSYDIEIDGINIHTDLLAITMIFHRNHVPTILEIFQYIYYFIDHVDPSKITAYLDIDILPIDPSEIFRIRTILKLLYYNIFGYFMDVYDNLKFEPPANFSTSEFNVNDNNMIKTYVRNFLMNLPTISQMEFYFVAEMVHMRQFQKLYHNILFNKRLITNIVGATTAELVGLVIDSFKKQDNDYVINIDDMLLTPDFLRKYWDELYQHNILSSKPDELYYSTFNIDRYNGKSYLATPYISRDFELNQSFLPNGLTLHYGMNPNYYDHKQVVTDYIPLPPTNNNILDTYIPINWIANDNFDMFNCSVRSNEYSVLSNEYYVRSNEHSVPSNEYSVRSNEYSVQSNENDHQDFFQLFGIDYFRIRHNIFFKQSIIIPKNIKFIDEYQFNLLKLIKLTERLYTIYPNNDKYILHWLWSTIFYLLKNTIPSHYSDTLNVFLNMIETMNNEPISNEPIPKNMLENFLSTAKTMFYKFNTGEQIEIFDQQKPYHTMDLVANNVYVYNEIMVAAQNDNLIDKLIIIRDNFLTQYFYYVKHRCQIEIINNLYPGDNNTVSFVNMSHLVEKIINAINTTSVDLVPLSESPIIFLYPNIFPERISKIVPMIDRLDDFSQYIYRYLMPFLSYDPAPRLTMKDIVDIINITFMSVCQIFDQADNLVLQKLAIYQPLLLDKIMLFGAIKTYLKNISLDRINSQHIADLAQLANNYHIDYDEYYHYLDSVIKQNLFEFMFNPSKASSMINIDINSSLDYFILKYNDSWKEQFSGINVEIPISTTFKDHIIQDIFDIFTPSEENPLLKYFQLIDNDYYAYIYFFMKYVKKNNLNISRIKNPIATFNKQNLISDHYEPSSVGNAILYLMDYVWDDAMGLPDNFDYKHKPSIYLNQIHQTHSEIQSQYNNIDRTKYTVNMPEINNPKIFSILIDGMPVDNIYFMNLDERTKILNFMKDSAKNGIVVINKYKKEIDMVKDQIYNILYRNKKAKTAWIRKLAHFIIEDATFKCGDQIVNHHISDWFEIYHEISKNASLERLYHKMIGHRDDLIIFDDKIKKSYTITMPLIFYFNRSVALSIPLNASTNTKYEITIRLRKLSDMTYKEQFSKFINTTSTPTSTSTSTPTSTPTSTSNFKPTITNAYLMVEYIYLGIEERKIFITSRLEYLIDELQYDTYIANDDNLDPIYKIGSYTKTDKLKKSKKIVKSNNGILVDQNQLNSMPNHTDLVPRNDYQIVIYTDRTGIAKSMMSKKPLPNVDPYIHTKRSVYRHYFNHPTKLAIFVIKPCIHIDAIYRTDDKSYFYHEKQWDNYGLYSYYDLSKIYHAKKNHYEFMKKRFNDLEDPEFGFIAIINQLLLQYGTLLNTQNKLYGTLLNTQNQLYDTLLNTQNKLRDSNDQWIESNQNIFLENIQKIKDMYNSYNEAIMYGENMVRLKKYLLSLHLDYPIINTNIFGKLISDIYQLLNLSIPDQNEVVAEYLTQFKNIKPMFRTIDKDMLEKMMIKILDKQIQNGLLTELEIISVIKSVYQNYNEAIINFLLKSIGQIININNITTDFKNLMEYFYGIYLLKPNRDQHVMIMTFFINQNTQEYLPTVTNNNVKAYSSQFPSPSNDDLIQNLTWQDVIHQIVVNQSTSILSHYQNLIPSKILGIIIAKMEQKFNEIVNNLPVNIINYQENMVANPEVNPLIFGHISFNGCNIMPVNSNGLMWSAMQSYQYTKNSPSTGINLHSWALEPLNMQPTGGINLTKINEFTSELDISPLISNSYPATVTTMVINMNIMRYLSGMCGKAWE